VAWPFVILALPSAPNAGADGRDLETGATVRTIGVADGRSVDADGRPIRPSAGNSLKNNAADGAVGADANFSSLTGEGENTLSG
jgi:hypothetical protein